MAPIREVGLERSVELTAMPDGRPSMLDVTDFRTFKPKNVDLRTITDRIIPIVRVGLEMMKSLLMSSGLAGLLACSVFQVTATAPIASVSPKNYLRRRSVA